MNTDSIDDLANTIKQEVLKVIKELGQDIDYGVEIFIYSEDLREEDLKNVIKKLLKDLKITYIYPYRETGYYEKKIMWREVEILLGIRPAIL